jgi:hypothetical protein
MLQIIVANNIKLRGYSVPLRAAITEALTIPNPAYVKLKRMRRPTWGIEQKLKLYVDEAYEATLVVPRGFEGELRQIMQAQGLNPADIIKHRLTETYAVDFGEWTGPPLRDYQTPAVADVWKQGGGVLVAPAGSGKTLMGCEIIREWHKPTLWLTHTLDLLEQSAKAAEAFLGGVGEVGRIGAGKTKWGSGKLFIATVQTLNANPQLVETLAGMVGVIVVDEAHHFPSAQFIEIAGKFPATYLLGLTATPDRKDGLERFMYAGLGPIAHTVKRDGMYEAGALVLPEVKFVYTEFGLDGPLGDEETENNVDAGGEDLDYVGLIADLTADEKRAKLVAENILASCFNVIPKGGAVIVLADSVRYLYVLRDLVEKFARASLGVVPRMAVAHGGLTKHSWKKTRKPKAGYDPAVYRSRIRSLASKQQTAPGNNGAGKGPPARYTFRYVAAGKGRARHSAPLRRTPSDPATGRRQEQ